MEQTFGTLVLLQDGTPEREYELSKANATVGRALTNDIVLGDARVSRSHARLDCSAAGCRVVDLGSSNGVRVNGVQVDQATLRPGDIISIGNSQLRYEVPAADDDLGATRLDTHADIMNTIDREILPMSINETNIPQLVVFTEEKTWQVPLDALDSAVIGRADGNQVIIDLPGVSRQHAAVVRSGRGWTLRDMGSTNGTWLDGHRVDELALTDGLVFRIGRAQLIFKSGQPVEALTMLDESFSRVRGRRPVVFVPGFMGSEMWQGNERLWPNIRNFLTQPEAFLYPSAVPLEPRGIVDEMVIVPNLIKHDQYNRLGDYLTEELGYVRGRDFFEFAYDWRDEIRVSARRLGEFIETLPNTQPITLMGHSLGTLVSRFYVERLGGKKRVERLLLMGGPHQGAVKPLMGLLTPAAVLPFGLMGERFRQVVMTFPSMYHIQPRFICAWDQNGNPFDFYEDESWLPEQYRPMLRAAKEFFRELGTQSSVPTISIFGYGLKTIVGVRLKRSAGGEIRDVTYMTEAMGDDSVPDRSAVLPGTEIHPVQQHHGSLFADNDVRVRLKLELARQFEE